MLVYLASVEERPFRAVFGYRIKLGFSPGEAFSRDTSTQVSLCLLLISTHAFRACGNSMALDTEGNRADRAQTNRRLTV